MKTKRCVNCSKVATIWIGHVEYIDGRRVRAGWCEYNCYFNNIPVMAIHGDMFGDWHISYGVEHGT